MGDTGLEQKNVTPRNSKDLQNQPKSGDAESGALSGNSAPNMAELMQRLSDLSVEDKAKLADLLTGDRQAG